MTMIRVIKRNGRVEPLDIRKIQKYTSGSIDGLENVNQSELELDAHIQFRDKITTKEIQETLIKTAVEKIDVDRPDWTFVAARLFLYDLYHKVSRFTGYSHFRDYFEKAEAEGRIIKGLQNKYDLDELNDYIDESRDLQFNYLGVKTLYDRYLLKDKEGNPIELPQQMFMAISMFLAQNELDSTYWAKKFYDLLSKFEVMVATPTLSNARTYRSQLSSCYIGSTSDNIEGIFDTYKEMALLSKYGGGIGWDWNQVRGMGGEIAGHKNAAGGTVPFLKITNDVAIAVDQLGTRRGAIAVYLEPWHIDINDFLDLKKNSGEERRRAHDLFPALWLNDLFMKRIQEDGLWTLFDPFDVPNLNQLYGEKFEKEYIKYEKNIEINSEKISAKGLWKKILTSYFETGNPFLTFKDTANRANPNSHEGIIRSSNLCVTGNTKLATQFGLISAKELFEMNKKIIATFDHRVNGERENRGVSNAQCIEMHKTKENANIYEIKTKDGYKIKSTSWHEYYILREKSIIKIPLKEIKLSDKLLIQSAKGQFGKEGSYELGFLTGLIAGDGTFSSSRKKYSTSHIDLYNEDMKLGDVVLDYSSKIIKDEYPKLENSYNQEFVNQYPKPIKHTDNSTKLRFTNVRLGRILDKIYNFNKNTKLKVPDFIYKGKEESVKGYLQGLFIADGTVNVIKNNKIPTFGIQLATISENFLNEIQLLLSNFGIRSKMTVMVRKKEDRFEYTKKSGEKMVYESKTAYRLSINGDNAIKFINEIGFIGVKQEKALNVLLEREKMGYPKKSNKTEKFETQITSIIKVDNEDVYDTTQLLNHSLIFNGIVTGNCTEIFQNTEANHYKIKIIYEDETISLYEENDEITTDENLVKKAKNITALDQIEGKKIYIVEKEMCAGKTAVCNLASINLSKINTKEDIERVVPTAIRMLDNVIELNFYPLRKVKDTNLESRAIGLGVMGEAEMLAKNKIEWGSEKHLIKIDEIMEAVSFNAISSSSNLAIEKGKYPKFENSNWSKGIFPIDKANEDAKNLVNRGGIFGYTYDWDKLREKVKKDGMRNGYLMAIAPTSSISILVGTTQAIEPIYKRKWFEENLSGMVPVVVPKLSAETWHYYTSAYELNQLDLIKAGAVRQKWIDQGQSLNIFISLDKASGKYLNDIYMLAWKLGLKSTYYLRSQSPESLAEDSVADRSMECLGCQ